MKHKLNLKLNLLLAVVLMSAAGCGIKTTTVVPPNERLLPAKDATHAQLLDLLRDRSNAISTLKATVTFDMSRGGAKSGVLDEYRQTRGSVVADRPDRIRVQVQMPLVLTTVATMVSDGQQYKLSIPVKNQFAVQDVNAPIDPKNSLSALRPQIFLDGLFVDTKRYIDKPSVKPGFEEAVEGIHSYYVVNFYETSGAELELLEKIWIDRQDLEVVRKQVFGKEGKLETDVTLQEYHREGPLSYPKVIVIHRPSEDATVKITFQSTTMNQPVDAKIFDLPRPEGSELLNLTAIGDNR